MRYADRRRAETCRISARLHVRCAWLAVRRGGLRSFMAVAAMAVGSACTIVTLALDAGARASLDAASASPTLLTITPGLVRAPPGRAPARYASPNLQLPDADDLRRSVPGVRTVVPMLEGARLAKLGDAVLATSVRGVTPPYTGLRGFTVLRGRALDDRDDAAYGRVAVVGAFVARRLGGERSIVGEVLTLGAVPFEVVGELREKGLSSDGSNEDNQVLIPFATAQRRLFNTDSLSALLVEAADGAPMTETANAARTVLRRSHALDLAAGDDFEILLPVRARALGAAQNALLRRAGQVVSAGALLLACFGVLVVTSMNVADRVSEVGLRRAVGARRKDVAALLVAEAACIGMVGGALGVTAGASGVLLVETLAGWPAALDAGGAAGTVALSTVLACLCGGLPALRAAKAAPIDALATV